MSVPKAGVPRGPTTPTLIVGVLFKVLILSLTASGLEFSIMRVISCAMTFTARRDCSLYKEKMIAFSLWRMRYVSKPKKKTPRNRIQKNFRLRLLMFPLPKE